MSELVAWGAAGHRTGCTGSFKAGQHLAVLKVSEFAAAPRDGCAAVTPDYAVVRNMTFEEHKFRHHLRLLLTSRGVMQGRIAASVSLFLDRFKHE